jgi:polyhydroxyalkanoate synthesis repressor PhaR
MRVIKKYPNRRLYDPAASRHITLADILQLVLDGTPFQVVDRKTEANITCTVLLQVIAEQEQRGPALLSELFLSHLIRAAHGATASLVKDALDRSLAQFPQLHRDTDRAQGGETAGA